MDRVAKFLGIFLSKQLLVDWKVAEMHESKRSKATWEYFVSTMQKHYKLTENLALKNHQFRSLTHEAHESFSTFCNRVYKVAPHCNFKCHNADCTAENTAIREQIIIGTTHEKIREDALKNSLDFQQLRKEGMRIESATKEMEELNNESPVNIMGKYFFRNTKNLTTCHWKTPVLLLLLASNQDIRCCTSCRARTGKRNFCDAIGNYEAVCKKKKVFNELNSDNEQQEPQQTEEQEQSDVDIFRITETAQPSRITNNLLRF